MSNGGYVLVAPAGVLESDCLVHILEAAGVRTTARFDPTDTVAAVVASLPGQSLAGTVVRTRAEAPELPLLLVVASGAEAGVAHAQVGAPTSVVSWQAGGSSIIEAVRELLSGSDGRTCELSGADDDPLRDLTMREQGIAALLAQGRRNHEIAAELGISHHTVRTHVNRVLTKLGVPHRHAAAAVARRSPSTWRHVRGDHVAMAAGEA